jgi:hypothetical protein
MSTSTDVQLVLLSYIPLIKFNSVCKSWNIFLKTNKDHINQKRICAVNKIGEWYLSKNFKFTLAPKFSSRRGYLINMFPKYTRRLPRHPGTERIINKIRYLNLNSKNDSSFNLLPYTIQTLISNIQQNSDADIFIIEQNNSIDNLLNILSDSQIPTILTRKNTFNWLLSLKLPYFIWPYISSGKFYTKNGNILSTKNGMGQCAQQ